MSEGGWFSYPVRRAYSFRPGDAVRVKWGPLVSATGIVERLAEGQRCIIALDGVDEGVRLIVDAAWLEMADPLSW